MERRIVQLGIVRQGDHGGPAVDRQLLQRIIRPLAVHGDAREPVVSGERPPGIDHHHVIPRQRGDRSQRLSDMDRADNDDPQGRIERVDEKLAVADFHDAAAVLP